MSLPSVAFFPDGKQPSARPKPPSPARYTAAGFEAARSNSIFTREAILGLLVCILTPESLRRVLGPETFKASVVRASREAKRSPYYSESRREYLA